jgi:hypothetical protein
MVNDNLSGDSVEVGHSTTRTRRLKNSTSSITETANPPVLQVFVIDELLAYICFFRNKSNAGALRRTVLSFFSPTDICCSKKLLVEKFTTLLSDCTHVAERRSSSTRAAHEAEIDDIINIIDILDLQSGFDRFKFVASNFDNLPKFGPEEINIAAIVD